MNCGQQASSRLQSFQANSSSRASDNVLDLNQSIQQREQNGQPAKSLHGLHAKQFHTQNQPQSQPVQGNTIPGAEDAQKSEEIDTAAQATQNEPGEQSHYVEAAPTHVTPATYSLQEATQETPRQSSRETMETTYMEPHRVYSLKNDPQPQQNDTPESVQQLENYELPSVEPVNTEPTAPSHKKGWLQKLSPSSLFNQSAIRVGTIGLCIVLLAGYVTYLNYPNIAVRVAASRANVNASMPEYVPDGYGFNGPVAYGQGKLTITFGGKDGIISLSQSKTQWDSQSLLENYINRRTSHYETYRQNGLTIYTYDNRHAAWVNGGTLYTIDSETYLSQNEIVNMASSL